MDTNNMAKLSDITLADNIRAGAEKFRGKPLIGMTEAKINNHLGTGTEAHLLWHDRMSDYVITLAGNLLTKEQMAQLEDNFKWKVLREKVYVNYKITTTFLMFIKSLGCVYEKVSLADAESLDEDAGDLILLVSKVYNIVATQRVSKASIVRDFKDGDFDIFLIRKSANNPVIFKALALL